MESKRYFSKLHSLLYLGFFSFVLTAFCFPNLLASKPLSYSEKGDIDSLSVASQMWLKNQAESPLKVKKISKDKKELRQIFSKLEQLTYEIKKPITHGFKRRHKSKNRNHAYLPYDENRTGKEIPGFYLSASDVITNMQHYIVAQAPLKHTVPDFWRALLHRNCALIVTTAMPIEEQADKAYAYWDDEAFPVYTRGWKIEHSHRSDEVLGTYGNHRLVRRTFSAYHRRTGERRKITQLHYENWPDNGIPNLALFSKLLDAAEESPLERHSPITVHCSAGIGRSGTFVACHSLRKGIRRARENGIKISESTLNIPEAVMHLRMQRKWMVATPGQLQTIYQVVSEEI